MVTFRTRPAQPGMTPSKEEMRQVAERFGVKSYSPALVADFVHYHEGGSFNRPSDYRSQVEATAQTRFASMSTQRTPFNKPNSPYGRVEDVEELAERMMAYHSRIRDFVEMFPLHQLPGSNALEKTMSLLRLLSTQTGGQPSGDGSGDDDPLPVFVDTDSEGDPKEAITEALDMLESLDEAEQELLSPDSNFDSDEESDGQRSGANDLQALEIAEKLMVGTDERLILEISRKLDTFAQMQIKPLHKQVADPNEEEVRQRPIRGLHELGKLSGAQWAKRAYLPDAYFMHLVISRQLPVRERYRLEEKRQAILILMDVSGSTRSGKIRQKMTGIVMNRLKGVVDGDAEVYLGLFDTELKILGEAKTPEEARELIKKFKAGNFSGGGTNIASGVKAGHAFIEEKMKAGEALWRPEVVVLTDEDSSANSVTAREIPGTTVHGFAIERSNPNMVALAESTGGVGVENF